MKLINSISTRIKAEPYVIINISFFVIILSVFIYSAIYSASGFTHPIKSLSIKPSVSTGLSRAFSEIVRFNFTKAVEFNPYSISIFLFFFVQLFMRIINSILLLNTRIPKKLLSITDILVTVLLFLLTFSKFILAQL